MGAEDAQTVLSGADHTDEPVALVDDEFESSMDSKGLSPTDLATGLTVAAFTPSREALRMRAARVLEADDPLAVVEADLETLYAGEALAPMAVYLSATSRVLGPPPGRVGREAGATVNLAIFAPSAAGKTAAMKAGLILIPDEDVIEFDAGSPRAIVYLEGELKHRVVLVGEADSLPRHGPGAAAVRSLAQESRLRYAVVERSAGGELVTKEFSREGPTVLLTTTTRPLEPQMSTRMLEISAPADEEQTRKVLRRVAQVWTASSDEIDVGAHVAFQRLLAMQAPWCVRIPFAPEVAELARVESVRVRRDLDRALALTAAVTVVRHPRRSLESDVVVAELDDYAAAHRILSRSIHEESSKRDGREARIMALLPGISSEEDAPNQVELSRKLSMAKSSINYWIKKLRADGRVVISADGRIRRSGSDVQGVLPSVDAVRASMGYLISSDGGGLDPADVESEPTSRSAEGFRAGREPAAQ